MKTIWVRGEIIPQNEKFGKMRVRDYDGNEYVIDRFHVRIGPDGVAEYKVEVKDKKN